jgi:hypothetical protein
MLAQPLHRQFRYPGHLCVRYPGREHQAHRVGGQPPGNEPQCLRRGLVEPLFVVHHTEQRPLFGHL